MTTLLNLGALYPVYNVAQGRRKALMTGGPQRLNRVNLYGKNPIPMEKL